MLNAKRDWGAYYTLFSIRRIFRSSCHDSSWWITWLLGQQRIMHYLFLSSFCMIKVTFHPQMPKKIDFSFIWKNWIQTFNLTLSLKKNIWIFKVSGRCHNLWPGRVPWGNFRGNRSGLNFHVISIFSFHRTLYKIHAWKLFVYGKPLLVEKSKA